MRLCHMFTDRMSPIAPRSQNSALRRRSVMKIAHLLLSSAAQLAVSSAAFAGARNNVISGTTAHSNIEVPSQTAVGSTATEDSLCLLPGDLSQWQAIPIRGGKR